MGTIATKIMKDENGVLYAPITHFDAVLDKDGNTLTEQLARGYKTAASVIMSPGVSSGNGNIWSLVGATLPTQIGTKYGNGFFSLE